MVFFTCNACGESLKKAQVDKHVSMCRGCQVLSCIDCGKDFWGDDYKTHIKCISEDQKYGGKGYEAKASKGDMKQQQWLQKVHEAMNKPGVSAKLRDVLQQLSTYDNVPRKKAKFQNWMKNSLKIVNPSLQEEVWNILSTADNVTNGNESSNDHLIEEEEKKKKLNKQERREARQQKNRNAMKGAGNIVSREPEQDEGGKKKKDRKRKQCTEEDEEQNSRRTQNETSSKKTKSKFNWKGNIKAILRESPDQEMSVKKLRKKVLAAYYSFTGDRNFKTEEEVLALFNKKINKNPKLRVLKDTVRLVK
uniref:Cell growth-regulating nucleolar protein n=1 Tax=Amphilophus citrinellus TaxID=61819 RepID=A0A3Q0R2H8_AMPCI